MDEFTIDGITLDPENKEFKYALECVQYTNQLIYLTGKAGTGKTTFLKYLRKVSNKEMVVLAPTGVAAINAKGQTIHSFFQIPPSLFVPDDRRLTTDFYKTFRFDKEKVQIIKRMELLVIDEVSMLRCDLLDVIDIILRNVRKQKGIPFGSVQVLLIGDTFQLPPIANHDERAILNQYYESEFFFSSWVLTQNKLLYIELKKIYRQKEQEFIDILNRIRIGKPDMSDIQLLNSRLQVSADDGENTENYIILTTTNEAARIENQKRLDMLESKPIIYTATIIGDFPEKNYPTDLRLELKVGAQVMFLKNNWEKGYYNGKIGKIVEIKAHDIKVEIENQHGEKTLVVVEPYIWENVKYTWNEKEKRIEEETTGTFEQYPLKLAWAITVHKSQGMTFEKVIADVGSSFAAGQVYVALSRCTSLNGLMLKSRITPQAIKTDPRVLAFAKNEVPETLILEKLQTGKADHYYAESRNSLKMGDGEGSYDNLIKAIKYRNDIETNLFKRYFCTWIKRYQHNLAKIAKYCETNSILKKQVAALDSERDELRTAIKTSENEIVQLHKTKNEMHSKIEMQKAEIDSLKKQVEQLKAVGKALERDKERISKELEKERSIKWYQKLFGKK